MVRKSYGIKNHGDEVIFSGLPSLLLFIKIYKLAKKPFLGGGAHRRRDRNWYLISLPLIFQMKLG
jgi:hypothetical protein